MRKPPHEPPARTTRSASATPAATRWSRDRDDVLELDVADALLERIPPGRAVAGRTAVVDLDDGEPVVDPGGRRRRGRRRRRGTSGRRAPRRPAAAGRRAPGGPAQQGMDPAARAVDPDVLDRRRTPAPGSPGAARTTSPAEVADGRRFGGRSTRPSRRRRPGADVAARTLPSAAADRRDAACRRGRSGRAGCAPRGRRRASSASPSEEPVGVGDLAVDVDRRARAARRSPTSQTSSSGRPRRSWPTSSRASPASGAKPNALHAPCPDRPRARRRSRPSPRRTTRSAGCRESPCSLCEIATSSPSSERSPTPASSSCA